MPSFSYVSWTFLGLKIERISTFFIAVHRSIDNFMDHNHFFYCWYSKRLLRVGTACGCYGVVDPCDGASWCDIPYISTTTFYKYSSVFAIVKPASYSPKIPLFFASSYDEYFNYVHFYYILS